MARELTNKFRLAIATDLHYVTDSDGAVVPQVCHLGTKNDPMARLLDLIKEDNEKLHGVADLLVCPGDITDRACEKSFRYGWGKLVELKNALGAMKLIASTGNHEISSRVGAEHKVAGNAELAINTLDHLLEVDGYPADFEREEQKWVYWGRGYEIIYGEKWVVVTINTCHYHNSLQPNEYERGRIGDVTLKNLLGHLKVISESYDYIYRVIVLHHPPITHEDIEVELGKTPMFNGDLLIQAIENTDCDWVIIHGHKHHHRIKKASGGEYAPVVISAASFGAMLTGELANKTRNQFYILELSSRQDDLGEVRIRGRLESLFWDGTDWDICRRPQDGIPAGCGFMQGDQMSSSRLAVNIRNEIEKSNETFLTWQELIDRMEYLKYLDPEAVRKLLVKLDVNGVYLNKEESEMFPSELWV